MTEKLKPCPFCGAEASVSKLDVAKPYGSFEYRVLCSTFMCPCAYPGAAWHSEAEALTAWNTRPSVVPAELAEDRVLILAETIVGEMQEEFPALDAYDEDEIASFEAKIAGHVRALLASQEG